MAPTLIRVEGGGGGSRASLCVSIKFTRDSVIVWQIDYENT